MRQTLLAGIGMSFIIRKVCGSSIDSAFPDDPDHLRIQAGVTVNEAAALAFKADITILLKREAKRPAAPINICRTVHESPSAYDINTDKIQYLDYTREQTSESSNPYQDRSGGAKRWRCPDRDGPSLSTATRYW
ncbi:MAG: hypothetical protein IPK94_22860 [Saprospiraceae bacterium]|nr:hypothetical protein [Saprospiraceae bacterium]